MPRHSQLCKLANQVVAGNVVGKKVPNRNVLTDNGTGYLVLGQTGPNPIGRHVKQRFTGPFKGIDEVLFVEP